MELISKQDLGGGDWHRVESCKWRLSDGRERAYDRVQTGDAVAIVAHDGENVYLVSQPRMPAEEENMLELPAGMIESDDGPLATAKRELVEEIGFEAASWAELTEVYSSPGTITEKMTLFLAEDLTEVGAAPEPSEEIEIIAWPLEELDGLVTTIKDAKTLAGICLLRERLRRNEGERSIVGPQ